MPPLRKRPLWVVLFKYWGGLFCLLGHMFPCMFHFKGGKGILSGGTIALMMDWRIGLVVWGVPDPGHLTRYVSLGSLWAGASFPLPPGSSIRRRSLWLLAFSWAD